MPVKRTSHVVYDTKYHVVWVPKYRKWIVREDIRRRVEQLLRQIAEDFGFGIEELEVAKDHVHFFLDFPPRYLIAKVVGILKSISASRVFQEIPELQEQLWKGEFWEDGYFVRTVGEVEEWRERFLIGAENALRSRPIDEEAMKDEQIKELKQKIGDLVVDNDLLREALNPYPLARGMSDA